MKGLIRESSGPLSFQACHLLIKRIRYGDVTGLSINLNTGGRMRSCMACGIKRFLATRGMDAKKPPYGVAFDIQRD